MVTRARNRIHQECRHIRRNIKMFDKRVLKEVGTRYCLATARENLGKARLASTK